MFFVRRNKATSRYFVLNTLPLAYDKTPLTSKQDKPKIGQENKA